ncbi:MAG: hypothetical protein F4X08_00045 [Gemmatimonadetes bacterium]|nr:hypothetical protein [Gemmatimonadota bacterium]MYD24188.1 hypothetical protein [Gemmatimonadota bacterium]MYI98377.1 hypothetical protein [Gemmatimonadota bacterium]
MPGEDQLEVPATRWDFLVERLNKVDNRLNKIDNRLSALEDAQKHVATKRWVVGTGLTSIVVLTGLIINLLNYFKP